MREALPLMPGFEPVQVIQAPPEKVAPPFETTGMYATMNGALLGCGCGICHRLRREDTAERERAQVAHAAPPAPMQVFNWGAPVSQRIPGRYTTDGDANLSQAGRDRWLDPVSRELYSTPDEPVRCNSGMSEQANGTWVSRGGMVWEPHVRIMQMGDEFDPQAMSRFP